MVALIWPAALLLATATLAFAALSAWRGWLDYKRLELASQRGEVEQGAPSGVRIEMADLKERLRKLEAIAIGVDP